MSSKYHAYGVPITVGDFTVQEERTPGLSKNRFRITLHTNTQTVLTEDQLFDLAEAVDTMCDSVEDERRGEAG